MVTLTLYSGPHRLLQTPISSDQAWEVLAEALNAWSAICVAPRAILERENVCYIVRLGELR